jgi:hypothetical protein
MGASSPGERAPARTLAATRRELGNFALELTRSLGVISQTQEEQVKRVLLALSAAAALGVGTIGAANALEFGVGPGGVYVGPGDHYYHHRYYDYGGCRTVITHRTNEFGERVTVRRRVCD